jgi:hypothetical protein
MAPSVQVSGLDDNGLLSEFKALQMLALYNGPGGADTNNPSEDDDKASLMHTDANNPSLSPNDTANLMEQAVIDALADEGKKCKHMDENLEEFLLQQVTNQAGHACMHVYVSAACAPRRLGTPICMPNILDGFNLNGRAIVTPWVAWKDSQGLQ